VTDDFIHIGDAAEAVVQNTARAQLDAAIASQEAAINSMRVLRTMLSAICAPRVDSATRNSQDSKQ
jgi:hypothetical protein